MKKEYDEYLVKKYPKIFADRYGDMKTTAMCWGFECGSGWFHLIDNLCDSIQNYIDLNPHLEIPQVVATQVKEKFGGLSFYYNGGDRLIEGMVWLASTQSYHICEKCGSTENLGQTEGWISVLCETCANHPDNKMKWNKYKDI
jgi:hypothetical protein